MKTLNFVITSRHYLESILATGERVDGSSLFDFVDASSSDLYVIPRFKDRFCKSIFRRFQHLIYFALTTQEKESLWRAHQKIYFVKPTDDYKNKQITV